MHLRSRRAFALAWFLLFGALVARAVAAPVSEIGRYRVFEAVVENAKPYANKFADVQLQCVYTAPSGREMSFGGFFDGDGRGGGDATSGNVWKLRFMPLRR